MRDRKAKVAWILPLMILEVVLPVRLARAGTEGVIPPEDAKKYVGKAVTVEGTVVQVSVSRQGTTFLNFGEAYPNQVFNAVIFRSSRARFSEDPLSWKGKRVRVTGTVRLYRGKPEIVLEHPTQIAATEAK